MKEEKAKTKSIDDLYFGVRSASGSWSRGDKFTLDVWNIFDNSRVKLAVASWVIETNKDPKFTEDHEFLLWCFGEVHWRCEYEFQVLSWPDHEGDEPTKVDVYEMFLEPNETILKQMVSEVSLASAKKYRNEERKRRGWG